MRLKHWLVFYKAGLSNLINCGPHARQSGVKAGSMKQNKESFIDLPKNFDDKTHHILDISNYSRLLEPKIVIQYFLDSSFH